MKLYLSSYQIGSDPKALQSFVGDNKLAAIIMNASDPFGAAKRPEYLKRYSNALAELGLESEELDLRQYFDRQNELRKVIEKYGLLWVTGGNTFTLRRAFQASGLDRYLGELLDTTDLVYGGFSAGACVLCPSLRGIHLCDEPNAIAEGYTSEIMWEGLGLIDFHIAPHYRSDHPESLRIEDVVRYYESHKMKYVTLSDGEAIVLVEGAMERVGKSTARA